MYNFKHHSLTNTRSLGAYASLGPLNANAGISHTYNFTTGMHSVNWNVGTGLGVGDYQKGLGIGVGYGSNGFNYGLGGYVRKGFKKGHIYDFVADNDDKPIKIHESLRYTNSFAKEFSDNNFGSVKGLKKIMADGSVPNSSYKIRGNRVYNKDNQQIRGSMAYFGKKKGANVYLYKSAFSDPKTLYLTMQHEYLHIGFRLLGLNDGKLQHSSIYRWQYKQAKLWNHNVDFYKNLRKRYYSKDEYSLTNNPNNFPLINFEPWIP